MFKCKNQKKCLHLSDVCNKKKNCLFGDDELSCSYGNVFVCPVECTCFAQSFICHHVGSDVITHIWKTAKYLKCYSCNFQSHIFYVSSSDSILFLSLKRFQFFYICPNENKNLSSLKQLDMSLNKLTITKSYCLVALNGLAILHLQQNSISTLEQSSFYSLNSLKLLDLSHNKIIELKRQLFEGLKNIKVPNITFHLVIFVSADVFKNMPSNTVHSFNVKVCCMSGFWTKCRVKHDAYSNCDSLIPNIFLRCLFWVLGIIAILLNITSFLVQTNHIEINLLHTLYFTFYLSIVDCLIGIYLIIITTIDCHYRGIYVGYEIFWRSNFGCKISSFLALLSMLASPMIIGVMMVARFCVIQWPMTSKFLRKVFIKRLVIIVLTVTTTGSFLLLSIFGFLEKLVPTGFCLLLYTSKDESQILFMISLIIA